MTWSPINWTNVTDMSGMLAVANNNANGLLFAGLLFLVSLVIFISLIAFGIESALLSGAFAGLILGIFLYYADLVSIGIVGIYVGIILLAGIYIAYTRR